MDQAGLRGQGGASGYRRGLGGATAGCKSSAPEHPAVLRVEHAPLHTECLVSKQGKWLEGSLRGWSGEYLSLL